MGLPAKRRDPQPEPAWDDSLEMTVDSERDAHCEKHGPYTSRAFMRGREHAWTACTQCLDEFQRQRDAEKERHREALLREAFRANSGVIGRYVGATFETFVAATPAQKRVLQACRAFVDEVAQRPTLWAPLWLIGPPGTGKTHLGSAIVTATIDRITKPARVATARELVREIRATWGRRDRDDETEAECIDRLAKTTVLVLDDVGVGSGTDAELVHLHDVLDIRYQLKRPTVIVSNLAAPGLRTALGDRLFDRLREGAQVCVCDWPSHRTRGVPPLGNRSK